MKKSEKTLDKSDVQKDIRIDEYNDIFPERFPFPRPVPWPVSLGMSGVYEWKWRYTARTPIPERIPFPSPIPDPIPMPGPLPFGSAENGGSADLDEQITDDTTAYLPVLPWYFQREELRLDVDGRYPQMTASGTMYYGLSMRAHWIASLTKIARNQWSGQIWYKHGSTVNIPYTNVKITATSSFYWNQRKISVVFSGGGGASKTLTYKLKTNYFHPVELEFDRVEGAPIVTSMDTTSHPNHPPAMPSETLTIENVYRRAGLNVSKSEGDGVIPLEEAEANGTWSDMEMHDAMQTYWSRFANKSQWSMWVLFASLHDWGPGLGGIMFDDIGPNHRQGTAIFGNAFISDPPFEESSPDAWVQRMRFWTACHEMGHAFNLAHSWQKELGTPWIPLHNENEARSFMNYPFRVEGGESAFFADFENKFSDSELLFMRHAPSEYVQMGNADWFDHHGFEQAEMSMNTEYLLEVRPNRDISNFEFLEPVNLELKLTNVSHEPKLFDKSIFSSGHDITVILKKEGKPARQWSPFARYCSVSNKIMIDTKKSVYHSLFVSAGLNGWDIAEPGKYLIQVAIKNGNEYIVSTPLTIRVKPPLGYEEEYIAQDLFNDDVGRVLALNGSLSLETAINTLKDIEQRLPERRIVYHARMALGNPLLRNYKTLNLENERKFNIHKKDVEGATIEMGVALTKNVDEAAETLGHINFKNSMDNYCEFLSSEGSFTTASKCQDDMHKVFTKRNILPSILKEINDNQNRYKLMS